METERRVGEYDGLMESSPIRPRHWETDHPAHGHLIVHRHASAYAAFVLEGRYEELSADGRYICHAGTLVMHPAHHVHANRFGAAGARVLNLTLPSFDAVVGYRVLQPADPSAIERLMWSDADLAAEGLARETPTAVPAVATPWAAEMARILRDPTDERTRSLSDLARSLGVTPEHASRGFKREFGLTPATYRREHRLRVALLMIRDGIPLADAALLAGFSDQSHLGRELRLATGRTPRQWHVRGRVTGRRLPVRRSIPF
jgi:AraC family transcriptional regulator